MNKKFSTLMAGLMLASAFSVNAAPDEAGKYENGKYYLLGSSDATFLSVVSEAGPDYGKLLYGSLDINDDGKVDLAETRNALWKVTVTQENLGDTPKYQFVNVATGQILSVATPTEKDASGDYEELKAQSITGTFMEWYNGMSSSDITTVNEFISYVTKNEVVYLVKGDAGLTINGAALGNTSVAAVNVERDEVEDVTGAIEIQPYLAEKVALGAEELNKELIMNNALEDDDTFTLSFNRDVTEGAAKNLFAATPLRAVQMYKYTSGSNVIKTTNGNLDVTTSTSPYYGYTKDAAYNYVRLYSKDNGYIVVDTALYAGSEAAKQLPKFVYDDPDKENVDGNNVNRLPESFNFKFAYDPNNNRVLIKSEAYYKRWYGSASAQTNHPAEITGADGNAAYTWWGYQGSDNQQASNLIVKDAYVRLVELSNVRELTVAEKDNETTDWTDPDNARYGMLTTVTIGAGLMSYEPTTIPTGLYLIQYKGTNKIYSNGEAVATDNYYIANMDGWFGYAEQARNQAYDHMPAAQWYVEQQGTIATAPVTITNREFYDNIYNDANPASTDPKLFGADVPYQAFKAPDGNYFFLGGAFNADTLKFIPVSDASKADSLLGYKHVDADQAAIETYVFNYLHGLALDKGLNTPSDKDSLVRVDESGEKASFRLVPVVEHDSYGIQLDEKKTGVANLLRNAYYIQLYGNAKFADDDQDRFLKYDEPSKKYVMSTTPVPYFLKENNCIDGTHYYALVEANLFIPKAIMGSGNVRYLVNKDSKVTLYPASLAGKNVDDLTEAEKALSYNAQFAELENNGEFIYVPFYAADGSYIVEDGSENVALYAYMANNKGDIELRRVNDGKTPAKYYYINKADDNATGIELDSFEADDYADVRVSVDDNTLDLTKADLEDKWISEIRVSAFEVAINDSPLYRRFNGQAPETYGDATNAPVNLKFFRFNNPGEFLFENQSADNAYRDGIADKSISFLGVNNAYQYPENETRSYTMFVDTAYVRYNTPMPQYLIGIRPEVVLGDTTLCDASTHQHATEADALACEHTVIKAGFTRAMYLFNAQDSIDASNYDYQGKAAYGAAGYTRLAFKDAVHAGDTLYILKPDVTTDQLKATDLKDGDLFVEKIFLGDNKHKNEVFQFRLIDEDNNRFLIESEAEQNGAAVLNKDLKNVSIAPMMGGWVKVQNGVPVIARYQSFQEAIAQADVFDVNDEIQYDATANDEVAVENVKVIAGDGQVTIMGAAGKNVTITTVLGKTVVAKTIASDNETIAVPTTGIVAVAVEGEEAVMTIVK